MGKMRVSDFVDDQRVRMLMAPLEAACKGKKFSDIIDKDGHQYVDLVMEGGGVLGIALVGYTYVLEQMGIRFLGIGGTSAGAINALLVASLNPPAEPKSEKMIDLLANTDLSSFVDGDKDVKRLIKVATESPGMLKLGTRAVQVVDSLREDLGLNPGLKFHQWLSDALKEEGITTARRLQKRLEDLPKSLRVRKGDKLSVKEAAPRLALVAADISTETKVEFPKMAAMYWYDPEIINPADYVRASMSIPFFFHPFVIEDVPRGKKASQVWQELAHYDGPIPEQCVLVDGGVMSNFPIDLFHSPDQVPIAPTFGAKLGTNERQVLDASGPLSLAGAVFSSASHCLDYDFVARNPDYRELVTWIDTRDHHWLAFDMKPKDKIDLFYQGALAAQQFLIKFNWKGYKRIRKQLAKAHSASGKS